MLSSASLHSLQDHVAAWCRDGRIVGAELLIRRGGEVHTHAAFGWRNRERRQRLEVGSIYRVRSMAKPFVATAALMLADAGALDVDDAVARYLPSWDNPRSRAVTLRQLMGHVGGFEQSWPRPLETFADLRAAVDAVGEAGPRHPPGVEHRYSDVGGATVAAVVAAITGEPIEDVLRARILAPLNLADTHLGFDVDAPWVQRMVSTYRWLPAERRFECYWDPSRPQRVPFFRGGGGMYTTLADYATFLEAWMHAGRHGSTNLLRPETVHAALQRAPDGRYGMFWDLPRGGRPGAMPPTFGHVGTDGTWAMAVPELDLVALYFTQSRNRDLKMSFGLHLGDALDLPGPMSLRTVAIETAREWGLRPETVDVDALAEVEGRYQIAGARSPIAFELVPHAADPSGGDLLEGRLEGWLEGWLKGERVHLIPLGARRFAPGWIRNGAPAEVWREEGLELRFLPSDRARAIETLEIRQGDKVLTRGPRL